MTFNYALFIKINRLCQGVSSSSLAEVTGVEKTQLHRLEKGQQQLSSDVIKLLFKGLNLDEKIIHKNFSEYGQIIDTIQRKVIYADEIEAIETELKNINLEMKSTFLTCDLLLANYMFNISIGRNKGVVESIEKILQKCTDIMTDDQIGKFYLYKSVYQKNQQKYLQALDSLKIAETRGLGNNSLLGMVYRITTIIYCRINKIRDAILYNEKAKEEFVKDCNFYRIIQTINQDGIISFYLKQYDKAIEYFQKALYQMKSQNYPVEDYAFCYLNIHLCMIMQRRYDDAKIFYDNFDEELKGVLLKKSSFIMHQAIKYFFLDMKKECLQYVRKYKETFNQIEPEKVIIKYLNRRIKLKENEDKRDVIMILNQAVSICKKNQNFSDWDLIIQLVCFEYQKDNKDFDYFGILFESIMSR